MKEPIVDTFTDGYYGSEEVLAAYDEANYHFTLQDFEKLLYKHGLAKLLKDMSDDSAFELLKQAAAINNVT